MNNKLTALLTTAVVTGLLAGQTARAEDKPADKKGSMAAGKDCCKGHSKNKCKCIHKDKKMKGDKDGCAGPNDKNGCNGEAHPEEKK